MQLNIPNKQGGGGKVQCAKPGKTRCKALLKRDTLGSETSGSSPSEASNFPVKHFVPHRVYRCKWVRRGGGKVTYPINSTLLLMTFQSGWHWSRAKAHHRLEAKVSRFCSPPLLPPLLPCRGGGGGGVCGGCWGVWGVRGGEGGGGLGWSGGVVGWGEWWGQVKYPANSHFS